MSKVIGECGKHAGYNMVNCPMCAIEEQQELLKNKYHAVVYSGYWNIQEGAFYGDKNILDSEQVGAEQAEANAKRIVDLLNSDESLHDNMHDKPHDKRQSPIKEDGEDELWDEVGRIIFGENHGGWYLEKLAAFRSKFHIARKTPNQ